VIVYTKIKSHCMDKSDCSDGSVDSLFSGVDDFTWVIDDWTQPITESISPEFFFHGLAFQLRASHPNQKSQFFSIRVVLMQNLAAPRTVSFKITLINSDSKKSVIKRASKAFSKVNAYESVAMASSKVLTEVEGFLVDGLLHVAISHIPNSTKRISLSGSAQLSTSQGSFDAEHYTPQEISPTPPPLFQKNSLVVNVKSTTGYVGLRNQGATCYMNSLLQSLFHLPAFRRIVYLMPTTGSESVSMSIPLNLQRLFCQMQLGSSSASTIELTKSFGWSNNDTMQQQDVQEFCRVLLENLETKLKKTELSLEIPKLFQGKTRTVFKCKNIDFIKNVEESFMDISLMVQDCKTIYDSFDKETQQYILEGENMYNTELFGLQETEVCTKFVEFPSVLHLHLRRFERDPIRDRSIKINSRLEFPSTLDLSKYMSDDADKSRNPIYDLHGVLVHSGGSMCGHYYAYLRTTLEPQWYKFDDIMVSKVTEEEAIEFNFGGFDGSTEKVYSGYMLVYVRKEDVPAIFEPVPNDIVPKHLLDHCYFSGSKSLNENDPIELRITTENTLRANSLHWITGFDTTSSLRAKVFQSDSFSSLYDKISQLILLNRNSFRLWRCAPYPIPTELIVPTDDTIGSKIPNNQLLFVQEINDPECFILKSHHISVYLKFFFSGNDPSIQYIGYYEPLTDDNVHSLFPIVNEIVGLPLNTPLIVFQETLQRTAQHVSPSSTFESAFIGTGTVLVFQVTPGFDCPEPLIKRDRKIHSDFPSKGSMSELSKLPLLSYNEFYPERKPVTLDQFFDFRVHSIKAVLCDVVSPQKPTMILRFPSHIRWSALKQFVCGALNISYDPEKDSMCLFKKDPSINGPIKTPINSRLTPVKMALLSPNGEKPWLYYQIFPGIPESSINSMANVSIQYYVNSQQSFQSSKILLPKGCTVHDILFEMARRCLISQLDGIRALNIHFHRIVKILSLDEIAPLDAIIRFEAIPQDQVNIQSPQFLLQIIRGHIDEFNIPRVSGDPFLISINLPTSLKQIQDLVYQYLDIPPQNGKQTVFALQNEKKTFNINFDEIISDSMLIFGVLFHDPIQKRNKTQIPTGNCRTTENALRISK